jgi:hypothetical protein
MSWRASRGRFLVTHHEGPVRNALSRIIAATRRIHGGVIGGGSTLEKRRLRGGRPLVAHPDDAR